MSLSVLAFLVSIGTVAGLLKLGTSAIDTNTVSEQAAGAITPVVSSDELTIELGDEPVFAVLPVDITVEQATEAGYTLTAFAESTDLVSTTDESKTIPMIAVDEGELAALADNTYGLALVKPESKDEEVYTTLSTDADNPTFITDKDYEATEANDTTTIYYGFYITPDVPYGTYTGSDINYEAKENEVATVVYDGNGLYFSGDRERATNMVRYDTDAITPYTDKYSYTSNLNDKGEVLDDSFLNRMYPVDSDETFVYEFPGADKVKVNIVKTDNDGCPKDENDYFTFWAGNYPNYTAKSYETTNPVLAFGNTTGKYVFEDYRSVQTYVDGDVVTIAYTTGPEGNGRGCHSGYGYYAILTGYTADGTPVYLTGNGVVAGKYILPGSEEHYHFLGWSEDKDATKPTYITEKDIATKLSLNPSEAITLYAIWEPAFTISYDGNDADSTTDMDNVEQYTTNIETTSQVDLLASNFKKDGYGFAGWSTDADAWNHLTNNDESDNPTIYGPNQTITVNPATSTKLTLYAVWVPVARNNGEPVELQNWNGCSALDITTYNNGVFTVGKNTITALKDSRDGNVYTVARLADGNCWMTENLRLDNEATISTTNTHNPVVDGDKVAIMNNDGNTSAHLSPSSSQWCDGNDEACLNQSNLNTSNVANTTASPVFGQDFTSSAHSSNFDGNIASYGNYYNWYSATAGQGTYSVSSGNASGDICPTGWQLPYGGNTKGGFYYLNQKMGKGTSATDSNNWRSFPNNFVYSGSWVGSSALTRGGDGRYWSSTASSNDYAYVLYFYSGYVGPDYYGGRKYYGLSVRCVAPVQ